MSKPSEPDLPESGIRLLRHAYVFVNERWQHLSRDLLPDQVLEEKFRESCTHQPGWVVSQNRELNHGAVLVTPTVWAFQPAPALITPGNRVVKEAARGTVPRWAVMARAAALRKGGVMLKKRAA